MLEKLPDALGHALRGQRAGLDAIAFQAIGLRAGMGAIRVQSLAITDHAPIPVPYTADGEGLSPPLGWSGVPAGAPCVVHAMASGCLIGTYERPDGSVRDDAGEPVAEPVAVGPSAAAA
jgi:hypothetical protein